LPPGGGASPQQIREYARAAWYGGRKLTKQGERHVRITPLANLRRQKSCAVGLFIGIVHAQCRRIVWIESARHVRRTLLHPAREIRTRDPVRSVQQRASRLDYRHWCILIRHTGGR